MRRLLLLLLGGKPEEIQKEPEGTRPQPQLQMFAVAWCSVLLLSLSNSHFVGRVTGLCWGRDSSQMSIHLLSDVHLSGC